MGTNELQEQIPSAGVIDEVGRNLSTVQYEGTIIPPPFHQHNHHLQELFIGYFWTSDYYHTRIRIITLQCLRYSFL